MKTDSDEMLSLKQYNGNNKLFYSPNLYRWVGESWILKYLTTLIITTTLYPIALGIPGLR